MKRYNYFDDDPVIEADSEKSNVVDIIHGKIKNISRADLYDVLNNVIGCVKTFIHSNTRKEKRIFDINTVVLKLTAVLLFIIAVVIFVVAFSHNINSQNEKNRKFCADAGKVCVDYISEYGAPRADSLSSDEFGDGMSRLTGLCYARQMNFDNDGDDELMLCYNNRNVYTLEVWGYVDKEFTKLYSEEVNRTEDIKDGCWVAFYYKNNKYYICKSAPEKPEKVTMLALKGDSFKETSKCDYDYKNNIYSIRGKINAEDFETIKLSVLKTSKAEAVVDIVTENINSFSTVSLIAINSQKTDAQLKADAYYKVVEGRMERFGKAEITKDKSGGYIDGVALVDLVDFNGDGNEELLLVYRKMLKENATNAYSGERIVIENPSYCIEVYSWNGSVTKKIFSRDSISNYMYDNNVNYVMLKTNEKSVNICSNSYSYYSDYNYTAVSRIYSYKDDSFDTTFSAKEVNNYGYKSYYLDGEYVYKSSFNNSAFKVPKFMDDDETYDNEKYRVIYFSGINSDEFKRTVNDTVKTIQQLNNNYNPDD